MASGNCEAQPPGACSVFHIAHVNLIQQSALILPCPHEVRTWLQSISRSRSPTPCAARAIRHGAVGDWPLEAAWQRLPRSPCWPGCRWPAAPRANAPAPRQSTRRRRRKNPHPPLPRQPRQNLCPAHHPLRRPWTRRRWNHRRRKHPARNQVRHRQNRRPRHLQRRRLTLRRQLKHQPPPQQRRRRPAQRQPLTQLQRPRTRQPPRQSHGC
jgi:hypothetical protein